LIHRNRLHGSVSSTKVWKGTLVVQPEQKTSSGSFEYPIEWVFTYPPNCSRRKLRKLLKEYAAHWPGWENFPWYMTRILHRHCDHPPADFDHLHALFWMRGYAANAILTHKFVDRDAVLDLLLREQVQFPGIFRQMVADEIRWCLVFKKKTRLPDCERLGKETVKNVAALAKKRGGFRDGIEHAESEFVRILNVASIEDDASFRIAGRPLKAWYKGGDLPEVAHVAVRAREDDGGLVLMPCQATTKRFASRNVDVPSIEVCPDTLPAVPDVESTATGDTEPDANTDLGQAAMVVKMATELDDNPRLKPPTHAAVLRLYCIEGLSVKDIEKKLKCSRGTVINRKKCLEKKLGAPLDAFKDLGRLIDDMERTAKDPRAKRIQRTSLLD